MSLLLRSWRLAGSSCFIHATSLRVRIASGFTPGDQDSDWTPGWKRWLQLDQNCLDYPGIQITMVQITEGLL